MADFLSERGKAFTGQEQVKSKPGQSAANFDTSIENEKTPGANLGGSQRIATVGETLPIVFGKRTSGNDGNGGVWVKPPLVKSGTSSFVGKFLFAISQGQISSSPAKVTTYAGLRNLAFIDDQTLTLTHNYATAASLSTTPGSCPIQGSGLFCGQETYSYLLDPMTTTIDSEVIIKLPDQGKDYWNYRTRSSGTGVTNNSVITATLKVYDTETGADVTANYFQFWLEGTNVNTEFGWGGNIKYGESGEAPCLNPGEISDRIQYYIDESIGSAAGLIEPCNATTVAAGIYTQADLDDLNAVSSGRSRFTEVWKVTGVDNQSVSSFAASTGTLTNVQEEYFSSNSGNPTDTSTGNNSDYADITFLQVNGNLYTAPSTGTYPTTSEQLYIYYPEGAKVDLYSAGLSSGSYTNAASNQFIDLIMYMFTLYKRTAGAATADIVAPVYLTNLQGLSTFCTTYGLTFNGIVSQAVNIVEFASSLAPFYLLSFLSTGGQYRFSSVLPLNGSNAIDVTALTPVKTFTEADIIPGTFQKGYLSVEDRREFIASCVYRLADPDEIGSQKTLTVKYPATSIDAPIEQFDMSACCTNPDHAIIYAKYELARRKFSKHNISFSVPLLTTELIPTDIIKITRTRRSSTEDADRTETEWYQVTAIHHNNRGLTRIDASHFPVNGSSISEISNEVLNGTFTVLS